ncbi:MFS transporter [Veillonella rodentium]|uniref:Inner membrane protein ybjJ n=1 Tax=Veillonella rodentium TaxID=248315 RepID=A0A239ZIM5_9FIRM|nr:MFS transporter [Veillonella rodentium]SNV70729.1 Inner membrane protein ybjJ [Veillonella rodentium]
MNDQVSISRANIRGAFGAFFISGMYTALWAGFVPYLKAKLGIGEDVLGSMILLLGVGSCVSMAVAGKMVETLGCKKTVLTGSFIGMLSLAVVIMCSTIFETTVALFFFGIGVGLSSSSANLQAILTEKVSKKHLMGAYHGGWSLGGFAGAGVLLVLLKMLSLPVDKSIWGLLIILFIAIVVISRFMLSFGTDPNAKTVKKFKSPLSFHPIAIIFGLLCFVSYLVEGAVGDWSALYLHEDKGILIQEAVMGVMFFNGTMCIGRLLGNTLGKHLSSKQVVVGGYLLGAVAMGLIVVLPGHASMYTYLLLGISLAMIVPNLFSAMGEQNLIPMTQAVATSTMLGYMGILMGPALIGFIAHGTSLTVAFIVLTCLLVVSAAIGKYAYILMNKAEETEM